LEKLTGVTWQQIVDETDIAADYEEEEAQKKLRSS
jgi:hypothetical protein